LSGANPFAKVQPKAKSEKHAGLNWPEKVGVYSEAHGATNK
jgi:hypothetical protein